MKYRGAAGWPSFLRAGWVQGRPVRPWAAGDLDAGLPTEPSRPSATARRDATAEMSREISLLQRRLRHAHWDTIMALVAAVEAKDPHTERHSSNVSYYAGRFARTLHLPARETMVVRTAAVLHDVGKIGIPDAVLTKPGPLTPDEFDLVKRHPASGAAIVRSATCLRREWPLVLYHHERYDGHGYPAGLKGDRIPLGARILHVADSIDAMLLPRSYKKAYGVEKVISELRQGRGTQFDPIVTDVGLRWLTDRPDEFILDTRKDGGGHHGDAPA